MRQGATQLDHTGKPDCPACGRLQALYERLGKDFEGMESRDAAFLIALMVHTIHQLAPDERLAAQFLVYVAEFLTAFQELDEGDERPSVCH